MINNTLNIQPMVSEKSYAMANAQQIYFFG